MIIWVMNMSETSTFYESEAYVLGLERVWLFFGKYSRVSVTWASSWYYTSYQYTIRRTTQQPRPVCTTGSRQPSLLPCVCVPWCVRVYSAKQHVAVGVCPSTSYTNALSTMGIFVREKMNCVKRTMLKNILLSWAIIRFFKTRPGQLPPLPT